MDSKEDAVTPKASPSIAKPSDTDTATLLTTRVTDRRIHLIGAVLGTLCFLSLALVYVKLHFSQVNASHARDLDADARWMQLADNVTQTRNSADNTLKVAQIELLLNGKTHAPEARAIARLSLPRLENFDQFQEIFKQVYPAPALKDIDDLLELARKLDYSRARVSDSLSTYMGRSPLTKKGVKNPDFASGSAFWDLATRQAEIIKIMGFLGNTVGQILRRERTDAEKKIDASDLTFFNSDLAGANFTAAIMWNTNFSNTDVEGASFRRVERFDGINFGNTRWWEAKEISPSLLAFLKDKQYPYYQGDIYIGKPFSKEEYFDNLDRLCQSVSMNCAIRPAKFPE